MKEKEKRNNGVAYILFLVGGTIAFLAASLSIKVPVYQTVEARVAEDSSRIMLLGGEREFQKECPVFIYESREEFLEKIETYHVVGDCIILEEEASFSAGTDIRVDVRTQEVSLLRLIFLKGGNSQS